jgi:outer membrane biosynthesis protein TonB
MGLVYSLELPPLSAPDVKKRVVKISVDGEEKLVEVHFTESNISLSPVKEGASVSLYLKDIDDAGNEGPWGEPVSFIAKDTLPPPAPGQVKVTLVSETPDEPPAPPAPPEPTPTPAPAPEPEPPTTVVEGDAVVTPVVDGDVAVTPVE